MTNVYMASEKYKIADSKVFGRRCNYRSGRLFAKVDRNDADAIAAIIQRELFDKIDGAPRL